MNVAARPQVKTVWSHIAMRQNCRPKGSGYLYVDVINIPQSEEILTQFVAETEKVFGYAVLKGVYLPSYRSAYTAKFLFNVPAENARSVFYNFAETPQEKAYFYTWLVSGLEFDDMTFTPKWNSTDTTYKSRVRKFNYKVFDQGDQLSLPVSDGSLAYHEHPDVTFS